MTRHFAVVVLDSAGNELEQITVAAQTYTALRRILHETPDVAAIPHTPGVVYENPAHLMAIKREARQLLQQAKQQREQLQQNVDYVEGTSNIALSQADDYVSQAQEGLYKLGAADTVQESIQQLGPPLFQATLEEVTRWVDTLRAAVREVESFIADVQVPQPPVDAGTMNTETEPRTFLSGFSEQELQRVPHDIRFRTVPLRKHLKPVNAAYLRLLEGFHLFVQGSAWERGLYERFDVLELENVPKKAGEFTKAEVFYLDFLHRYYTDDKRIDNAYLDYLRPYLSVRYLKHKLLCYLAEL